jgi:NADH dehydrogenase subunit A (EC 1.6.5.3)
MLENYFPVLMFMLVGLGFGVAPVILGRLLAPYRPDTEKNSPYECGFEAFEDARMKFDVRYYLIAILFILFDLEIAFLFPWATVFPGVHRRRRNRLVRIRLGNGLSCDSGNRLHRRVEEWRTRLGVMHEH